MKRDQIKQSDAQAMLDTQVNRATRLKIANDVLDNNGSPDQARIKVEKLHSKYLELVKVCPEEQGRPE